jgi:hypothetical protein
LWCGYAIAGNLLAGSDRGWDEGSWMLAFEGGARDTFGGWCKRLGYLDFG